MITPVTVLVLVLSLPGTTGASTAEPAAPPPLPSCQDTVFSGDIILQAFRAVEARDSSVLKDWLLTTTSDPDEGETPETRSRKRQAKLGLATSAWLTYRYGEAQELLDSLLSNSEALDAITPYAVIIQGEVHASRAMLVEADSAFARAAALAEDRGVPRAQAWAMIRLSNVRSRLAGTPVVARDLLTRAEALVDPNDSYLRGQFHCTRAGNDPQDRWTAEADARAGLAFAQEAGVRRLHAACLHVLASDQMRRGRTTDALATFREEQEEQKAIGDRAGRAATLQWAGYVLYTLGDFATSRAYLQEAVSEGEASGNLSPVAWAYISLARISQGLGDLATTRDHLDQAERLLGEQGDQWGLAAVKGSRATLAFAVGDRQTAREILRETLSEHERANNLVGILGGQTGLLELALASGDLEVAEGILADARALARNAGMGDWEWSFYFHEAEIALKRGDGARARVALDRFLLPGQFTIRKYRAQVRYAEALVQEGRIPEAAEFLESSLGALEEWRQGLDLVGLQRYAFQVGEYLPDPDLGVATVLAAMAQAGLVERAFDLAERQRARDLYERMVLAEIARHRAVEDTKEEGSLPNLPPPLGSREVLAGLPDAASALIEFVTGQGGEPTMAFILARGGIQAVRLPPADSLRRDIDLLRSLAASGEDPGPVAARLGNRLFHPILLNLPEGISRISLVPSGPLHRIPFDLLEPDSSGPLLERFSLSLAPSASVLAHLRQEPDVPSSAFLVLGDPAFDEGNLASRKNLAGQLARLPGASREARVVARFGHPAHLHLGSEAAEEVLKSASRERYGVIHLATHAVVDETSDAGTFLLLAPGGGEDGYLSPGDVIRLRLDADLVVLSGCRTAGGAVVRGEGVQGLSAPFLQAGARAVMVTQWPIRDRAGQRLIRDFYGGLADGESTGEALRLARSASRARGDSPAVWAAYTIVGHEGLRIPASRPGVHIPGTAVSRAFMAILALGALLFGGLAVWTVRKRTSALR